MKLFASPLKRRHCFANLDIKTVTGNKTFRKKIKPCLSDKSKFSKQIVQIEKDKP